MIEGVKIMATTGIGDQKLFIGEGGNYQYGLVNLAGFLGQCMKETIMYNACDENNWSNGDVAKQFGGQPYTASYACGQGKQSYQDYKCKKEDNDLAGGKMACDYDPNMEMRAHTQAEWYGAPPKMFCAPKSKVPKAPKWNYKGPLRAGRRPHTGHQEIGKLGHNLHSGSLPNLPVLSESHVLVDGSSSKLS